MRNIFAISACVCFVKMMNCNTLVFTPDKQDMVPAGSGAKMGLYLLLTIVSILLLIWSVI